MFKATYTGKSHAWSVLRVDIENIMKIEKDEDIANYMEIVESIADPLQRKLFLSPLSDLLTRVFFYDDNGRINPEKKMNILKNSFWRGLSNLIDVDNYNANTLFTYKNTKCLMKLYSKDELKDYHKVLLKQRDNRTSTIEKFPV